jgi:hypothetical protein
MLGKKIIYLGLMVIKVPLHIPDGVTKKQSPKKSPFVLKVHGC